MLKLSLPVSGGVEREVLNTELAAAGYQFSVAVLSREVDTDGRAVLDENNQPIRVAKYVLVKTPAEVTNAEQTTITQIVSEHAPS